MDTFKQRQRAYDEPVREAVPKICISGDHTFRVCKNVCGFREEDDALVKHGNKLFLILSADQKIVGWTLTRTLSHDEIEETLTEVSYTAESLLSYKCP